MIFGLAFYSLPWLWINLDSWLGSRPEVVHGWLVDGEWVGRGKRKQGEERVINNFFSHVLARVRGGRKGYRERHCGCEVRCNSAAKKSVWALIPVVGVCDTLLFTHVKAHLAVAGSVDGIA